MVTRTGTPGNDNIVINEEGRFFEVAPEPIIDIETGNGLDRVDIITAGLANPGFRKEINIDTGSDADIVTVSGDAGSVDDIVDLNINTGSGNDIVDTQELRGTDLVNFSRVNSDVQLGDGDDIATLRAGAGFRVGGRLKVDGGDGRDTINISQGASLGEAEVDGGDGEDTIDIAVANTDGFLIKGGAGSDRITLRDDKTFAFNLEDIDNKFIVEGGSGNDTIVLESEASTFRPFADSDFAFLRNIVRTSSPSSAEIDGGAGIDLITTGGGNDRILGGIGNDQLSSGGGDDVVDGGEGQDLLFGGDGDDDIDGAAGNDQISGDAGNDDIDGGAGNDNIVAGAGDDSVRSGTGTDVVSGDGGADTFIFGRNEGTTHVTDFSTAGGDLLDVSAFGVSAAEVLASAREEDRPFFDTASRQFLGGRDATVIDLEGTEIVLRGIDLDDLSEESFLVEDDAAVA